jgi:ADP-heptose:LPS heptosyltransferase
MLTAIISPFAKMMRNGEKNPKNYPWWPRLVKLLKEEGYHVIQIGMPGEEDVGADEMKMGLDIESLKDLARSADLIITVDNFFQHLCWYIEKKCYAIFSKSDPNIFGHDSNFNVLKDHKYLKDKQFDIWEASSFEEGAFLSPKEVMEIIKEDLLSGTKKAGTV